MSDLREAQLRQEFRSEIMRGYHAALCNSDVPGWTLGDEVGKVADNLLASLAAHPVEPAAVQWEIPKENRSTQWRDFEDAVEAAAACTCPPHPNPDITGPGDWDPNCPKHGPAPARVEITAAAVEVVASKLYRLSFGATDTPWDHPKHESIRERYRESARDLIVAALPFLQPQPVDRPLLDREQLFHYLSGFVSGLDPESDVVEYDGVLDDVMTLARPMPTREQIEQRIRRIYIDGGAHITHAQEAAAEIAAAVLALLGGVDETDCTCGFGGFHEERNPNCDRNRVDESRKS